jgi:predicted transcriptional regulator
MSGTDDYYQSCFDMSREELIALKNLVQVCKDIVELADNDDIVLLHYADKVNVEDDNED